MTSGLVTILLVIFAVVSCDTNKPQKFPTASLLLAPLYPYQYEFDGEFGRSRIDFYFVSSEIRKDSSFVTIIRQLVDNKKSPDSSKYSYYSIYVYEKTDSLNESFRSTAQELKSVYKAKLLSYSRWNRNLQDVFYIIESGNVVYDVLENKAISTDWEFE